MKEYFDREFYSIEEEDGVKYIHISGRFDDDYEGSDDDEITCQYIEYTWFIEPLEEFLKWKDDPKEYDMRQEEIKQYIDDITEKEAIESMNTYFDGKLPVELSWDNLTMDTPCGDYVNY